MDEIRKNQIIQMELRNKTKLEGIVFSYSKDRVDVLVSFESLPNAKKVKELDEMFVKVNSHLGAKYMFAHVINPLMPNNCITIENAPSVPVEQKREFVRVLSNIVFKIKKQNAEIIDSYCINISAGGIAFSANNASFEIGENIDIIFNENDFEKEIKCSASIIKIYDNYYVAKYLDLKPFDEDKIVKYVFKLIAEK